MEELKLKITETLNQITDTLNKNLDLKYEAMNYRNTLILAELMLKNLQVLVDKMIMKEEK